METLLTTTLDLSRSSDASRSGEEGSASDVADFTSTSGGSSSYSPDSQKIVWKQSKAVRRSKMLVFLGIILAAVAGGITTGFLVRREEKDGFDAQFQAYAQEIENISALNAERIFSIIHGFSKSITVAAKTSDESFPLFTMPFFEVVGGEAQQASGAEVVIFAPLVEKRNLKRWEEYSVDNQGWVKEGLSYRGLPDIDPGLIPEEVYAQEIENHTNHVEGQIHVDNYVLPIWQMAGAPTNGEIVNLDLLSSKAFEHTMVDAIDKRGSVLSYVSDFNFLTEYSVENEVIGIHIQSYALEPVYETLEEDSPVAGVVVGVFPWDNYFNNILPEDIEGIMIVINDNCGDIFTYEVNGEDSLLVGEGDLHDPAYDSNRYSIDFATFSRFSGDHPDVNGTSYSEYFEGSNDGHCKYVMDMYPSKKLESKYESNHHIVYSAVVVSIFAVILGLLVIYDRTVIDRQKRLLDGANRIIASLFPKSVQKQLMEEAAQGYKAPKKGLEKYQNTGSNMPTNDIDFGTRPIAELFLNTTIIFADIVGFTAWSSMREPCQVFMLLETIYHAFDEIANQRRVFKVETIGDCYVAVTGLPDPRKDHAVVMCRFARECLSKFMVLVKQMEVTLGPDTGDLGLRVGLHSGPVTAGVLRGEKARFQLFGDSMNTAARIESNGAKNRIHISEAVATLLTAAGKAHWLRERPDKITAKGKGEMTTFWLEPKGAGQQSSSRRSSSASSDIDEPERFEYQEREMQSQPPLAAAGSYGGIPVDTEVQGPDSHLSQKTQRLVKWNTDNLASLLKAIVADRNDAGDKPTDPKRLLEIEQDHHSGGRQDHKMIADEVVEVIQIPQFSESTTSKLATDPDSIVLPDEVLTQLESYVQTIAAMYPPENAFHNFEHASHVCMSVQKLLFRIVDAGGEQDSASRELLQLTHGITSDPLLRFCVVLAALIHDVDHPGVPNSTLVNERSSLAAAYKNKSVAEQNSVDLAWDLLMDESFIDLRRALYTTESAHYRVRQLVVNSVMATDIMDKELGAFRRARWAKAFDDSIDDSIDESSSHNDDVARKVTIVLEHLIQASDVAHTMQHWHVFIKWNERLYGEMYRSFKDGRSNKDPSIDWYKSELGFFDYYIIPLAKKLESCGVFGVSSAEYLDYAVHNRREWELKGQEVVARYAEKYSSSTH